MIPHRMAWGQPLDHFQPTRSNAMKKTARKAAFPSRQEPRTPETYLIIILFWESEAPAEGRLLGLEHADGELL